MNENDYLKQNQDLWDAWTELHARSDFYDVEGFRAGKSSLMSPELEALPDVSGKSMLHLQCHFGMDSISWARRGARVTAVDFSEIGIAFARQLNDERGTEVEFICANVYDLRDYLIRQYDIVFTSYGVLDWLPDMNRWAEIVAHYLKPGGVFYLVEFHPAIWLLGDDHAELRVHGSYFHAPSPDSEEVQGSYAEPGADVRMPSHNWTHPVSDVVNALLKQGLRLEAIQEYPYSVYDCFAGLRETEPGQYRFAALSGSFPMMYSLKMIREG